MGLRAKAALVALAGSVALFGVGVQAQGEPAEVRAALNALKAAPSVDQRTAWDGVVALGDAAVDALIAEAAGFATTDDTTYVGLCIEALGAIGDARATDVLVDVLNGSNLQLSYQAAYSLRKIWEGKGGSDDTVKAVNAALLAALYSEVPDTARYGGALAFVYVNGIQHPDRVEGRKINNWESLTVAQISAEIETWVAAHPESLPGVDQQPWQLNLRTALHASDAAARARAVQALAQKRDLGPVEGLVAALADGSKPGRDSLAQLLGNLTGVPFPPAGIEPAETPAAQQASAWRSDWLYYLRTQDEPKYLDYSWRQLEGALSVYSSDPSKESAQRVKEYLDVVLRQYPDEEAVPGGGSKAAKALVSKPLAVKKKIAEAVAQLESDISAVEKYVPLDIIGAETRSDVGKEVGAQFLGRLALLAQDEQNQRLAQRIGALLTHISGVFVDLNFSNIETRQTKLSTWVDEAMAQGVSIEFPGS